MFGRFALAGPANGRILSAFRLEDPKGAGVPDRPNVLVVFSDQHRRDAAGCRGHPLVRTPAIDRLAGDGVCFDNAYCASPICGPCRSAVLTGRHVHRTGAYRHCHMHSPMGLPTMGTVFREAGYATAAFGKLHVKGETDENDLGFDERALRIYTPTSTDYQHAVSAEEYAEYDPGGREQYNPANRAVGIREDRMLDTMATERSLDFLRRRRGEPFFLWMGLDRPHPSWRNPERFHAMYDPADMELPDDIWEERPDLPATIIENAQFPVVTREAYTDDQLRACTAAYYASVSYADDLVGRALDELDRLGLADDTVVVYASDHGENLFSHGLVHKHCFFEQAAGVPLVLRGPGVPSGETRAAPVSLVDLLPTLTDLCGLDAPPDVDGRSLGDLLDDADATRDAAFSEFYEWGTPERMVRTGRWKYVHSHDDRCQLYDLETDPGEHVNRVDDPAYAETVARLDALVLDGWEIPDAETLAPPQRR